MAPCLTSMKLAIITVAVVLCQGGQSGFIPKKTKVQITNALPNNWELTLHCKDKNHDLGDQTLKNGATYEFSFKPSFFLNNTLYFCNFWWPTAGKERLYYVVYKQDRDDCTLCTYKVSDYAICDKDGICYPWHQPPLPPTTLSSDHTTLTSSHDDVPSSNAQTDITVSHP